MRKKILLLLLVFFFTFQVSATVFGTFPQQLEKNSDSLSTEIGLGMINAGNSELKVEFSSPESDEYNISLPDEVVLEPSTVTESPEGEGWYYLGDDQYAKYKDFSFDVEISQYRKSNTVHVPLQITANSKNFGGTAPVSRFREYNYTVYLNPSLRPLDRQGNERDEPLYWEEEDSSVPEEWRESSAETGTESREGNISEASNQSEDYKSRQKEQSTGEKEGTQPVTLALVAGIVLTAVYIIKVT
jgi:hypothetical protein